MQFESNPPSVDVPSGEAGLGGGFGRVLGGEHDEAQKDAAPEQQQAPEGQHDGAHSPLEVRPHVPVIVLVSVVGAHLGVGDACEGGSPYEQGEPHYSYRYCHIGGRFITIDL
ncbi:hypothetical protein CDAR_469581 [Caerostris darwini]|uniref:Uncharacterized protein n=1 Tax=Caerostris darwini TaxID=1538125 RepID=A0AAV4QX48_9ARAC|nr:hypothetical protein CDAR_469581 [Caerostris darwini]